jgi:hypothetical protein
VDQKRQQRISEHFGELQQQYLQMCTSTTQRQVSNSAGTASVGTEQAAALPPLQYKHATAVVRHSNLLQDEQNAAGEGRGNNGDVQGGPAGGQHAGMAAGHNERNVVAMGEALTHSEERLDQLDCMLRSVSQVCSVGIVHLRMRCCLYAYFTAYVPATSKSVNIAGIGSQVSCAH